MVQIFRYYTLTTSYSDSESVRSRNALSVFRFVRIFCPFRSVVNLSATFLRPFVRKNFYQKVKFWAFSLPTYSRALLNLGGNKNEKLSSLSPAVSVKQTASKTL